MPKCARAPALACQKRVRLVVFSSSEPVILKRREICVIFCLHHWWHFRALIGSFKKFDSLLNSVSPNCEHLWQLMQTQNARAPPPPFCVKKEVDLPLSLASFRASHFERWEIYAIFVVTACDALGNFGDIFKNLTSRNFQNAEEPNFPILSKKVGFLANTRNFAHPFSRAKRRHQHRHVAPCLGS